MELSIKSIQEHIEDAKNYFIKCAKNISEDSFSSLAYVKTNYPDIAETITTEEGAEVLLQMLNVTVDTKQKNIFPIC